MLEAFESFEFPMQKEREREKKKQKYKGENLSRHQVLPIFLAYSIIWIATDWGKKKV